MINLTTTKTPDVPSGGSFAVKTKTCFTWARNNTTRVLVTTAVEWTGRSFIKGMFCAQVASPVPLHNAGVLIEFVGSCRHSR